MIKTVLKAMSSILAFIIRECAQWNVTKMMSATDVENEIEENVKSQQPPEEVVNRNKRKLEKTEERFASSVANADSGTTTSTPKKRRKTEAPPRLDFSGISPILAGAPDHRP